MSKNTFSAAEECLQFINKSVSCYHVVENAEKLLKEQGFEELKEQEDFFVSKGKGYYVKRNDSSVIAFKIPKGEAKGFHIIASHSDSPTFKIKAEAEQSMEGGYVKLNVEPYGGMIHATWLDRCLSVAGRIAYMEEGTLKTKTVNVDEDLLVIPNVAIHMNREMNKSLTYNPQVDLQPLLCAQKNEDNNVLLKKIAFYAKVKEEDILGKDLFLYVREAGKLAGADRKLMIAPRLDDQECVFASLKGLLVSEPKEHISICAVFDNEEVGSRTRQGASSTFLKDILERMGEALEIPKSNYLKMLSESFMISADNAHGVHPNHPEKADPTNKPYLNQGIVIKYHGGQKYTTDAWSEAVMKSICKEAEVPYQTYCNRSDISGGSTLGNISQEQISVACVDIGLPQLAMHSAVETAGSKDVEYLVEVAKVFFGK